MEPERVVDHCPHPHRDREQRQRSPGPGARRRVIASRFAASPKKAKTFGASAVNAELVPKNVLGPHRRQWGMSGTCIFRQATSPAVRPQCRRKRRRRAAVWARRRGARASAASAETASSQCSDETTIPTCARRRGRRGSRSPLAGDPLGTGECSLGTVLVAASERGICAICWATVPPPSSTSSRRRFPDAADSQRGRVGQPRTAGRRLRRRRPPSLDAPLNVHSACRAPGLAGAAVPAAGTASYAEVAARIGAPASSRGRCVRGESARGGPSPATGASAGDGTRSGYR